MAEGKFKVDFCNSGYKRYWKKYGKRIIKLINACYADGNFVLRKQLFDFEKRLAKFLGVKYAAGVASGTDALKIAYRAANLTVHGKEIQPGDEVITVSHTFIAPIEEIVHIGAKPILVDVGEDALMDVDLLEAAITERTVGIVPVHLSGKVCDMERVMEIAKKHNLWVVEDACQALGAYGKGKYAKKRAGTIGHAGCFSFIAPKTLGAGGDGGGIVTNDQTLYETAALLRNHSNITQGVLHGCQPKEPDRMIWGYNSRLDCTMAVALDFKLKNVYRWMLARRKKIYQTYAKAFKDLPFKLPTTQPGQIYQEIIVRVDDAEKFKAHMTKCGVEVLVRDTITNHKKYEWYFGPLSLPVTEAMATSAVRLPSYPELKDSEVNAVINAVRSYYAQG